MFSGLQRRGDESLQLIEHAGSSSPIWIVAHVSEQTHEFVPFPACWRRSLQCRFDAAFANFHRPNELNWMKRRPRDVCLSGCRIRLARGKQGELLALHDNAGEGRVDERRQDQDAHAHGLLCGDAVDLRTGLVDLVVDLDLPSNPVQFANLKRTVRLACKVGEEQAVAFRRRHADQTATDGVSLGAYFHVGIDRLVVSHQGLVDKEHIEVGLDAELTVELPTDQSRDAYFPVALQANDVAHVVLLAIAQELVAGISEVHQQSGASPCCVDLQMNTVVLTGRAQVVVDQVSQADGPLLVNLECRIIASAPPVLDECLVELDRRRVYNAPVGNRAQEPGKQLRDVECFDLRAAQQFGQQALQRVVEPGVETTADHAGSAAIEVIAQDGVLATAFFSPARQNEREHQANHVQASFPLDELVFSGQSEHQVASKYSQHQSLQLLTGHARRRHHGRSGGPQNSRGVTYDHMGSRMAILSRPSANWTRMGEGHVELDLEQDGRGHGIHVEELDGLRDSVLDAPA